MHSPSRHLVQIFRLSREVEVVVKVVADGIHVLVVREHTAVEVAVLPPLLLPFEIVIWAHGTAL